MGYQKCGTRRNRYVRFRDRTDYRRRSGYVCNGVVHSGKTGGRAYAKSGQISLQVRCWLTDKTQLNRQAAAGRAGCRMQRPRQYLSRFVCGGFCRSDFGGRTLWGCDRKRLLYPQNTLYLFVVLPRENHGGRIQTAFFSRLKLSSPEWQSRKSLSPTQTVS